MMEYDWRWNYPHNLIWRYFTPDEKPFYAKCNLCEKRVNSRHGSEVKLTDFREHLMNKHSEKITEIREEIRLSWLSPHFAFDQVVWRVRCIFCSYYFSIFEGVYELGNHLFCHDINENSMTYILIQRNNIDIRVQQSVAEEDNASTSAHVEPANAHSQPADQEG